MLMSEKTSTAQPRDPSPQVARASLRRPQPPLSLLRTPESGRDSRTIRPKPHWNLSPIRSPMFREYLCLDTCWGYLVHERLFGDLFRWCHAVFLRARPYVVPKVLGSGDREREEMGED